MRWIHNKVKRGFEDRRYYSGSDKKVDTPVECIRDLTLLATQSHSLFICLSKILSSILSSYF